MPSYVHRFGLIAGIKISTVIKGFYCDLRFSYRACTLAIYYAPGLMRLSFRSVLANDEIIIF